MSRFSTFSSFFLSFHTDLENRKRDQRDIIIRKSVEVHDSVRQDRSNTRTYFTKGQPIFFKPDNEISTDGLPNISSTPSSTAPIETTTGFAISSEMFYNLQEELRTVKNHHLTHGEYFLRFFKTSDKFSIFQA